MQIQSSLEPRLSAEPIDLTAVINPTAKQAEFLSVLSEKQYPLYGGAMGGGKSYILRWGLIWWLLALAKQGFRHVQAALMCEDYPALHDRHITKIRFEFPAWLGELKIGVTRDFVLHPQFGGGTIALRNLDDPSKYASAEFGAIAVDELTKNPQSIFDFLRTRLRWPGVEKPRFLAATNPGGIGHSWVKRLWIDRSFPPELSNTAQEFNFVPAKASDNPHNAPSYYQQLETLPPAMREAFLEGRWDIFRGQYFDIFDRAKHAVDAGALGLQPWWTRWISMDWGFDHPSVIHWHARDERGVTYTYREWALRQATCEELGRGIVERSKDEKFDAFYLSPDAFDKRTSDDTIAIQIGDAIRAVRKDFPMPAQADNDRVGGWQLMYQLLNSGYWKISEACRALLETLPVLIRDEDGNPEDIVKMDGDDAADAARYGLKSRLGSARVPLEERVRRRVEGIEDPTSRAIAVGRFIGEERKKANVQVRYRQRPKWG